MISHLRRICEDLSTEPDFERAMQLFAINACYSGQVSRLYVGRFHQDLKLKAIAKFEFGTSEQLVRAYEENLIPKIFEKIIQSNSVHLVPHHRQYRLLFKESVGFEESEHWKTSILIPLLPNFLAVLTTRIEVKESPNVLDYFNSLRAVLQLFLMTKSRSVQLLGYDRKRETNELVGSKLTERQDLILTLIQQGLTNVIIAQRLGYSESLIRQETITIYKKLGVNGRRDLYNTGND